MHVEIDVKCMHTNFDEQGLLRFRQYCYFQFWSNFPFRPWTIVHGSEKLNQIELAKKIHASRD